MALSADDVSCCIQVISMDPLTRRSRFILCVAVGLGLGVTIVPNWATNNLWDVYPTTGSGLAGFRSASQPCMLLSDKSCKYHVLHLNMSQNGTVQHREASERPDLLCSCRMQFSLIARLH